jgi:hypothetical protein
MTSDAFSLWLAQNLWLLVILMIWSMIWKGIALWKSARNKNVAWFVVFLIVNTLGILEILYIFVFSRYKEKNKIVKRRR